MTTSSTAQKKSVSSKPTQQKAQVAPSKKTSSSKKISGASAANAAKASATQTANKIVEFRFQCDAGLREQMNERIKLLRLDRSKVMADFIKEWLKQTDIYLTDASTSKK